MKKDNLSAKFNQKKSEMIEEVKSRELIYQETQLCLFLVDTTLKKIWFDHRAMSYLNIQKNSDLLYQEFIDLVDQKDQIYMLNTLHDLDKNYVPFRFTCSIGQQDFECILTHFSHTDHPSLFQGFMTPKLRVEKQGSLTHENTSFVANMTHDIRTPMHAILGYTDLLGETKLNDDQNLYLSKIKDASGHLLNIVNDILDYTKLESKKMTLKEQPFKLNVLLENVSNMVKEQINRKQLYFDIMNIDCPNVLIGDVTKIRQVLINLVSNAAKFTDIGGVSLTSYIHQHIDKSTKEITFKIKDTGIGMTLEQQQKLFQAFEQPHDTSSRLYEGTGLGLYVSQEFAKLMGGNIMVTSQLNEGSIFELTIPLKAQKSTKKDELEPVIKLKEGSRILLADDNILNQKLTSRILKNMKMIVTVVNDGIDAVEACKTNHFDLILMDIQMPKLNGFAATEKIRAFDQSTPILAMTADLLFEDQAYYLAAKMNGYVYKPVDPLSLHKALLDHLPHL